MAKIKSPDQVFRQDGKNCFMELTTFGLARDKISLNFVNYNTSAEKGGRVSGNVMLYLDIHKAEGLAHDILSGRMAKMAVAAKAKAAEAGYKYARDIFCDMTGSAPEKAKRADGMGMSRQFKITPGAKLPWILSAESGPGRVEGTGIIAPAYSTGKAECIVRIPMTDDQLKQLALAIKAMCELWYMFKFWPVIGEDELKGTNRFTPAMTNKTGDLRVMGDSLGIDRVRILFGRDPDTKKGMSAYLDTRKAMALGNDIISGRLERLGASTPKVYETMGSSKHGDTVTARPFSITKNETGWIVAVEEGPGKLDGEGTIVPAYDKPDKSASAVLTNEELNAFGHVVYNLAFAWARRKFGAIVKEPIDRARKETEEALDAVRKKNGN